MRTCTIDDCDRKHEALGLCRTHYRASRPRRPDAKVELQCDGCGKAVMKERRTRRHNTVQCSDWLCRHWLTWGTGWKSTLPAEHWARMYGAASVYVPKNCFECQWCGTAVISSVPSQRYCTRACKTRAAKAARRGLEYGAIGTYSWSQVVHLWATFDKACAYCGKPTPLTEIQAEHVQALSRDGANNLSNLLPSCGACNSDKRELSLSEWATDRVRRNLSPVATSWPSDDTRYAHLSLPALAA